MAKSWSYDDQTALSCWKSSSRWRANPGAQNGPIYFPCLNYTKTVRRACWTRWTLLSHSFPTRSGAVVQEVAHVRVFWRRGTWSRPEGSGGISLIGNILQACSLLFMISPVISTPALMCLILQKKNKHSPQILHCVILNIKTLHQFDIPSTFQPVAGRLKKTRFWFYVSF